VDYLCRPGKLGKACSATLGFVAPRVFYNFSSSAPPFQPNHPYAPFAIFALLQHGGDFGAAAKVLRAQGYGKSRMRPAEWRAKRALQRRRSAEDTARQILLRRIGGGTG
jgi:hypothetical protein